MLLYNSLTQKTEEFSPIDKNSVKMYVCGITPYDTTHLGHAFTYIHFDVLVRFLRYSGYKVTYTQNVTDIDDDLLQRAQETKKDWKELGDLWTNKFLKDLKTLNIAPPDIYVKATDSIPTMIIMISELIKKKYAYEANGNVYFDISKRKNYGSFSHFTPKQMLYFAKERGGTIDDKHKKNPLDFVLWQSAKNKITTNDPFWKSPWGNGRPGWHIECSAMIFANLGEQIDIHGGGRDLVFPHHENEIAQSESFTNKVPFVRQWMHTSMLMKDGEKMAKSLGNLVMVSDLVQKYSPNAIRWVLLSHHYRSPWEYNVEEFQHAEECLLFIDDALRKKYNRSNGTKKTRLITNFEDTLSDDLDTPQALEYVLHIARKIHRSPYTINLHNYQHALHTSLSILGFSI